MADSITIDLCGRLADIVGPSLILPVAAPLTVADILAQLTADHPALGQALGQTRVHAAIDEALTGLDATIVPGQRLALFPPVSGG